MGEVDLIPGGLTDEQDCVALVVGVEKVGPRVAEPVAFACLVFEMKLHDVP